MIGVQQVTDSCSKLPHIVQSAIQAGCQPRLGQADLAGALSSFQFWPNYDLVGAVMFGNDIQLLRALVADRIIGLLEHVVVAPNQLNLHVDSTLFHSHRADCPWRNMSDGPHRR
jgi:hypothetical protein